METRRYRRLASIIAMLFACLATGRAPAAGDGCTGFTWDVQAELAALARPAVRIRAGRDSAAAPLIGKARAYRVALAPQSAVHFAAGPGKFSEAGGRFAGLARVKIPRPGRYRVSLDAGAWVDVVVAGNVVQASAYTGSHECARLRKVVEFQLPSGSAIIQVSDSPADHVRLLVTASTYRPDT